MATVEDPKWSWRYEAKCRGEDTEIFYPPRNRDLYRSIAEKAKGICFGRDDRPACPVREECLIDAIDRDELHGIWGGMSHRERNALVRRASRARMSVHDFVKKGGPS